MNAVLKAKTVWVAEEEAILKSECPILSDCIDYLA